jgi:hypothetical protein
MPPEHGPHDPESVPRAQAAGATSSGPTRRGLVRPFRPRVPDTLRALYQRYCETEARALVELLPREGRRALLRFEAGEGGGEALSVDTVYRAARRVLPLPPYEVWVPDYLANRAAYLERMGIPAVPDRTAPVTVDVRPVGNGWWASLNLRRLEAMWVGSIVFHPDPSLAKAPVAVRTSDIFRGPDPEALRARFREFPRPVLEGFLRSAASNASASVL